MTDVPLDELREQALSPLRDTPQRVAAWAQEARPEDGAPGRFRWSLETTRGANVGSTANVLGGLGNAQFRSNPHIAPEPGRRKRAARCRWALAR